MTLRRIFRVASLTGMAVLLMAAIASASPLTITYNTNATVLCGHGVRRLPDVGQLSGRLFDLDVCAERQQHYRRTVKHRFGGLHPYMPELRDTTGGLGLRFQPV